MQNFPYETQGNSCGNSKRYSQFLGCRAATAEFVILMTRVTGVTPTAKRMCYSWFKEVMWCLSQWPVPSLKPDKTTLRYSE